MSDLTSRYDALLARVDSLKTNYARTQGQLDAAIKEVKQAGCTLENLDTTIEGLKKSLKRLEKDLETLLVKAEEVVKRVTSELGTSTD